MKPALLILGSYLLVYVGSAWFVAFSEDESHLRQASQDHGWVTVSPATLQDPFISPRLLSLTKRDLRYSVAGAIENCCVAKLE